jgi:hypothetical protein
VGQLAAGLSDLPVSWVLLEYWPIRLPEVAEALASAIALRNPAPEPSAGLCPTVSDNERYDLPGPTAKSHPEPPFVRPFSDICPAFVELKNVVLLGRTEPIGY